jgi:hypothetical protein
MADQPQTKPLVFPIKFKVCLRLAIGGRLHHERLDIFRKFWSDQLKDMAAVSALYNQPYEHPTDESRLNQANIMIDKFTSEGVDESWFHNLKNGIPEWRRRNMVQQRINARARRTLNDHRRKLLLLFQNRIGALRKAESAVSLGKNAVSLKSKPKKVQFRKRKSASS